MSWVAIAVGAGTAVAGAVAGAVGGDSKQINEQSIIIDPETGLEKRSNQIQQQQLEQINQLVEAGPGTQDVTAATGASRSLADLIARFQSTGGLPGQSDIQQSQQFAQAAFRPQQVALEQAFEDQSAAAQRNAAIQGRSGTDPVLQARLAAEQTRQQNFLGAQQGAFANQLAMQAPQRQIGLAGARADVLGGLATQAMSNRSSLLSLGNQLRQQERQFRLATATRRSETSQEVGAGDRAAAAISGGISGFGAGVGMAGGVGQVSSMFSGGLGSSGGGGGGGGGVAPQQFNPGFAGQASGIGVAAPNFAMAPFTQQPMFGPGNQAGIGQFNQRQAAMSSAQNFRLGSF